MNQKRTACCTKTNPQKGRKNPSKARKKHQKYAKPDFCPACGQKVYQADVMGCWLGLLMRPCKTSHAKNAMLSEITQVLWMVRELEFPMRCFSLVRQRKHGEGGKSLKILPPSAYGHANNSKVIVDIPNPC